MPIVLSLRARQLSHSPALRDRKRLAAMIAPQVQVVVCDQENTQGRKVAIAADKILESGPALLGFRRLRGHLMPLGQACLRGYTSEIYALRVSERNTRSSNVVEVRPRRCSSSLRGTERRVG